MEQPNEQPIEYVQSSKNIWITVIAVIITALIVGGGIYAWQRSNLKNTEQSLEQQISVLQNQINQLQEPHSELTQQPTNEEQPDISQAECGKLIEFKDKSWGSQLATLYKNNFLEPQRLSGNLWPEGATMAGEVSSCKIEDYFVFIPEFFEFGCGRIFKYEIKSNVLEQAKGSYCARELENIGENYIEFTGWQGDGGSGTQYNGKYYYKENRTELDTKN